MRNGRIKSRTKKKSNLVSVAKNMTKARQIKGALCCTTKHRQTRKKRRSSEIMLQEKLGITTVNGYAHGEVRQDKTRGKNHPRFAPVVTVKHNKGGGKGGQSVH